MTAVLSMFVLGSYLSYSIWKLKKHLHMLQLNSYLNERYAGWLGQHLRQSYAVKEFLPCLACLPLVFGSAILTAGSWTVAYLFLFLFREHAQEKKALVFTPRAMRLYAAMILVLLVICALSVQGLMTRNNFVILFQMAFLIFFNIASFLVALIANFLESPLERRINLWYFRAARKRIREMPRLRTVGITGSYGKTSTKAILQSMMAQRFHVLMTPESYNTPMGISKVIRADLRPVHEIFIAEMGARQLGDISTLCDLVSPHFGILTSIGEQHLETFHTLDAIKRTKFELIDALPPDGIAFLNMDNEHIRDMAPHCRVKCISFGIDSTDLHYSARHICMDSQGCSFDFCLPDGRSQEFRTSLLGRHNIYNMLGAAALACELGVDVNMIQSVVRNLTPLPHRLEVKNTSQEITIIDDAFNSNPAGARSALEVLQAIDGKKKILITPGMVELGKWEYELNRQFGCQAAACCDYIILVGRKQSLPLQDGLRSMNFSRYYVARDLYEANQHLRTIVTAGDVVLYENDLPDTYNE
ncbi:Mur ligase [candidate division KSB3 bacterium]|uniref:Mur ligase n=1 Tax=candidate division KSB3 bacterium TaxID=2044937 RepID=A0A2G6E546_9BACT|nr:MAG: Mur ligase [candidate division KSB3 bacterium]PIE29790.1 MAG: Mur ligase [candidate division KSB3 bacterium]